MSENKALKISKKIEISKPLLWLIWFFLFILPSALAIVGFNYFKDEYLYFSQSDLINLAFNNIRAYNEAIVPEAFLEERIKELKEINPSQSLDSLKKQIDNKLCGETLFCMFFDEKAEKTTIIKSTEGKNISINFLKKYFSKLIKAYSSDKDEDINKEQRQLAIRLQALFKTVTPISISIGKISKNFSVIHGGELYFAFSKFEKPNQECCYVFAAMKGKNFSFRSMLNILHNQFPEIRIVFREIDVNRTLDEENQVKNLIIHSGLKQKNNKLYILAPASLIFARHVLHDGTEKLNTRFGKLIPFIEYRIPIEQINNDLKKIEKYLNKSIILIILLSGVYFFYISLFGFNPNLKFKTKILILTLVAAFFPFAIFSVGIYSIENYNRFLTKINVQQQAEVELQLASHELNRYITEIEDQMKEFALELNELLLKPDIKASEVSEKLSEIAVKIPLSKEMIYLDPVPDSLTSLTSYKNPNIIKKSFPDRVSKDLLEEQNEVILDSVPPRIIELANEYKQIREKEDYFYLGNKKIDSDEVGKILANDGKLLPLNQKVTNIWYESQQLKKKDSNEIMGVYMAKFEPKPILSFFLGSSTIGLKNYKTIIKDYNYEINYAFLPLENSGTASIWENKGFISENDKILCLKNPQSGVINQQNKIIIKKHNHKIPHLAVATITELVPFSEKRFIIGLLIIISIYLLLIFIFTNKLIDIILVRPVKLLAENAIAIAQGGDDWSTEINSGDEFENLNKSFKNLVTGLKERNILKNYVSEDAFSDIEKSDSIKLLPGGEYTEATIVFSAIKDYEKLVASITPQESIKILSQYISIAENVCKKYDGNLDKILGNTVMLVFRNNSSNTSHGLRAAQAALEFVEKASNIEGITGLYTGIASGKVISGKIGSYSGKLDFTVIGNPVNLAARLKAEAKKGTEQTGIIISGTTIDLTKGKAKVKFLRRTAIKGKSREYTLYELIGIRN